MTQHPADAIKALRNRERNLLLIPHDYLFLQVTYSLEYPEVVSLDSRTPNDTNLASSIHMHLSIPEAGWFHEKYEFVRGNGKEPRFNGTGTHSQTNYDERVEVGATDVK